MRSRGTVSLQVSRVSESSSRHTTGCNKHSVATCASTPSRAPRHLHATPHTERRDSRTTYTRPRQVADRLRGRIEAALAEDDVEKAVHALRAAAAQAVDIFGKGEEVSGDNLATLKIGIATLKLHLRLLPSEYYTRLYLYALSITPLSGKGETAFSTHSRRKSSDADVQV